MNISSIIVLTEKDKFNEVLKNLEDSKICEVYFKDKNKSKIVIVIEGKNTEEEIKKLKSIKNINGILNTHLAMSCNEEELEENILKIKNSSLIPRNLANDDLSAEEISYYADLRDKI